LILIRIRIKAEQVDVVRSHVGVAVDMAGGPANLDRPEATLRAQAEVWPVVLNESQDSG